MTADATGRRVIVGPYEATAMGNALVQAMALGQVRDLPHLRRIVADSFELALSSRAEPTTGRAPTINSAPSPHLETTWTAASTRSDTVCVVTPRSSEGSG